MKSKAVFFCTSCGNETAKWQGKCPFCGEWNSIVEQEVKAVSALRRASSSGTVSIRKPKKLAEVEGTEDIRFSTGSRELDRVLGGGIVQGSLILVGGAPGIGKSTLLLQICKDICKRQSVLYISGEESEQQLKMRAQRLQVDHDKLFVLSVTGMEEISQAIEAMKPDVLMVDSIQTLYHSENTSVPGSVSQVKECTMTLMQLSKNHGISIFVVSHVNKEGSIAGPKVLEHMVDCVLYFEGERSTNYRLLRAEKNRFGSTNELGVFEMVENGLREVPNPSEMLISGRPVNTPGTCVACVMEGSRPILAEIQALVTKTTFNVPRRTTDGFDYNRANLLMAVMEKRGGMNLGGCDAYINVIGGLQLDEPAVDLPVVIAVASSYRDSAVNEGLTAIGEVGLTGEIRAVSNLTVRLNEIARLGFQKCIIPRQGSDQIAAPNGMELYRVRNIREAIEVAL